MTGTYSTRGPFIDDFIKYEYKNYGNNLKLKFNTKLIFLFKYLTFYFMIYIYEVKICKITIINYV